MKDNLTGGDDKLDQSMREYSKTLEPVIGREGVNAAIALIPYVGGSILSLMNDLAGRRFYERTKDVFEVVKERLEEVGEAKINKEFFKGEEFQTLLFLALEQLRTTHDEDKQVMLANALANSGLNEFSTEERKELFLRILRDLSLAHLRTLKTLVPVEDRREAGPDFWPTEHDPGGEGLAIFQFLVANGLVTESLKRDTRSLPAQRFGSGWTEHEVKRAIEDYVNRPSAQEFRISRFGLDFLTFLSSTTAAEQPQT